MPSDKDVVITSQLRVPEGSSISAKPNHLITFKPEKGGAAPKRFISLDQPNMTQEGWIQVKGAFSDQNEESIASNFKTLMQSLHKDSIMEMYFPRESIQSIRNLVFRAK